MSGHSGYPLAVEARHETGAPEPMTLEQWALLPEDAEGELVDGVLVEEEMAGYLHAVVVAWLVETLRRWAIARGGFVGGSDARFAARRHPARGRKPDLTVYLGGRKPPARGLIEIPPDIAVEVVSPSGNDARRDRVEKLSDYAAFGVRQYWILDPQLRTLDVLELGTDGRYIVALAATAGSCAIPTCPDLAIDLDALWAECDRLELEPI